MTRERDGFRKTAKKAECAPTHGRGRARTESGPDGPAASRDNLVCLEYAIAQTKRQEFKDDKLILQ